MALTWGDVMKFIVEADLPMEPFSTYIREGTAGDKIGAVLGAESPYRQRNFRPLAWTGTPPADGAAVAGRCRGSTARLAA
jgi:hypothetical protein